MSADDRPDIRWCSAYHAGATDDMRAVRADSPPLYWPLASNWWKPKDRRADLVRSAALAIAEIERLDRSGERGAPS